MKRWGLVGLVALCACGVMDDDGQDASMRDQGCPGVVAGAVPLEQGSQALGAEDPDTALDGRERFIVRYRSARTAAASRVSAVGGQVRAVFQHLPAISVRLSPEERQALTADPTVASIEPDVRRYALGLPSLPTRALLGTSMPVGGVSEYTWGLRQVQAPAVWDANEDGVLDVGAPTGQGVKVCVVDSGIDPDHPELKAAYLDGWDFVEGDAEPWDRTPEGTPGTGHGTHVAGTIAAQLGVGGQTGPKLHRGGVVGVAPGAKLLIARVLNADGMAWLADVIAGLEWCQAKGAHIASLSLGGSAGSQTERDAFQAAADRGMLIVAAAGNSGKGLEFPGALPSVLAVGAVDVGAHRASFSCQGENLALVAPGVEVLSTVIPGTGTVSEVTLGNTTHESRSLFMAPPGHMSAPLVDCGDARSAHSCRLATCAGFIAYVKRTSGVSVASQLANVMRQGARAAIIGDKPHEGELPALSIGRRGQWIPAAVVTHDSGMRLSRLTGATVDVTLHPLDYATASGTSMAAPHVSGVAALLWSKRPSLTAAQVRQLLLSTARDLGTPGKDPEYGHGLVQAQSALDMLDTWP